MSATSAHEAQNCTSRRAPVIPSPSGRFTSSEASFRHSSQSSTLSVLAAYSNCCHVEAPSSDVLAAMLVGMQLANRSEVEKEGRFAKSRMESQDQREWLSDCSTYATLPIGAIPLPSVPAPASLFSPHYCMIEDTVRTKLEDGYQEHAIASFCLLGQ